MAGSIARQDDVASGHIARFFESSGDLANLGAAHRRCYAAKMRPWLAALLGTTMALLPRPVAGGDVHRLNVTTMMPTGSSGYLEVKKWKRDVEAASGGRLKLRIYPSRIAGTDQQVMRKLRTGKLDAANVGGGAISTFVRQAKILAAPGMFRSGAHFERARKALASDFQREAYQNGFKLIGWSDIAPVRILSRTPVRSPQDLVGLKLWRYSGDDVTKGLYAMLGVKGQALPLPEVSDALRRKHIDMVYAPALMLMSMQWFAHLPYITRDGFGMVELAFVMGRRSYEAVPPELSKIFIERSIKLNRRVVKELRRDDSKVFEMLLKRGLTAVDIKRDAWVDVGVKLRERLVGDLYTKDMMDRVRDL